MRLSRKARLTKEFSAVCIVSKYPRWAKQELYFHSSLTSWLRPLFLQSNVLRLLHIVACPQDLFPAKGKGHTRFVSIVRWPRQHFLVPSMRGCGKFWVRWVPGSCRPSSGTWFNCLPASFYKELSLWRVTYCQWSWRHKRAHGTL